jgi:hypothetical protein
MPMMVRYTHLELDRDVDTPSGYYTPQKEVRLKYDGREVLYTVSQAVVESSCCGASDFVSAQVPGFIVSWRGETNLNGRPVSVVEPITDTVVQDDIRTIIRENEHLNRVEFW